MSSSMKVFVGGVLRVTVHYVYHSVTEEVLHQVFQAYGVVQISVSERADHVEAEVQLRNRSGAAQALALHGRCIYERSCLLDIQDVSPAAIPAKSDMGELCDLFDKRSMSLFNTHMRSLLQLKQTGTVVEYTAAFWERLHPVLDLNPNLNIKCFVQQYIEGLRDDIQAAVRSRSPSSITGASCLARIRENEVVEDRSLGADRLDVSSGAAPVQCRAGHDITTIDDSGRGARTPTTESPSSDATVGVFPKLAASVESDEDLDTVIIPPLTPSACSTGGLAYAREGNDIFPATVGCIIMVRSYSVLCLHDNNDKHTTTQVSELVPTACPHPSPDRNLYASSVPRPLPWPSFLSDGDGVRLTYSGPATQGIWPCLQLTPAWLYSAKALLSKRPRCRELLYVNGDLKLLANCWKSSSLELPGKDWFLRYKGTDLVVQKNWDPGIIQRPFLNNLHGTYEVKFLWVLSMRRYAAYITDITFGSKYTSFENGVSIGIKQEAEYETMLYFFTVSAQLQHIVQVVRSLIGRLTQLEALQSACSRYSARLSCFVQIGIGSACAISLEIYSCQFPISQLCDLRLSSGFCVEKLCHTRWHMKNSHKDGSYCRCSFFIASAPWKSWKRYWSGALQRFQTNASMQTLDDARRGTCVELQLLVGSWHNCYGTGLQLNQQTGEMMHLNNEQLVGVTLWINNLYMVELAYCSPKLQMFIGMSLTRMIWSLTWLSNNHGEFVHTDCRMIKASQYKMEEQQKFGDICLHSCFPHSAWLLDNTLMAAWEKGSHTWEEAQGKCTHLCKFSGVHLSSNIRVRTDVVQLPDDLVKSGCFDAVLTHQFGLRCCIAIDQTWGLRSAENIRAQYKEHEQNTTVFAVISKVVLSLQELQWFNLLTIFEPQGLYWIAHISVVTFPDFLDAHAQWDPDGFLSTMVVEHKINHPGHSWRLHMIYAQGYRSIGMNDSPARYDPGIVAIFQTAVPVCVKARRLSCRSGSCNLLHPADAIAWGQAMFCEGGSVTPSILAAHTWMMGR